MGIDGRCGPKEWHKYVYALIPIKSGPHCDLWALHYMYTTQFGLHIFSPSINNFHIFYYLSFFCALK